MSLASQGPGKDATSVEDETSDQRPKLSWTTWSKFVVSLYYNKVAVNALGGVTGWSWHNRIDQYVILGALPTESQIRTLHSKESLHTVVNMCAEFPGFGRLYRELGLTQIRLETVDFTVPCLESIEKGVDGIIAAVREREKGKGSGSVYLHCKGGKGRSATVALCYLTRMYDLYPKLAQSILIECRPQIDKMIYTYSEVEEYYEKVLSDVESGQLQRKRWGG